MTWQIYCGFWPIAAGKIAIAGDFGRQLVWRTSLDKQTEIRLGHGHTINISRDGKNWMHYRLTKIQRITDSFQDVWLEPIKQEEKRLRDRLALVQ